MNKKELPTFPVPQTGQYVKGFAKIGRKISKNTDLSAPSARGKRF
ncbi:hypothetical protein [Phormidium sp. CCY1219]|nr:hypothetical protein [Phormidium sp. CCY1219]